MAADTLKFVVGDPRSLRLDHAAAKGAASANGLCGAARRGANWRGAPARRIARAFLLVFAVLGLCWSPAARADTFTFSFNSPGPGGTPLTGFTLVGGGVSVLDTTDTTLIATMISDYYASTIIPVAYVDDFNSADQLASTYELDNSEVEAIVYAPGSEDDFALVSSQIAVSPEPSTLALFTTGLAALLLFRRRLFRLQAPDC